MHRSPSAPRPPSTRSSTPVLFCFVSFFSELANSYSCFSRPRAIESKNLYLDPENYCYKSTYGTMNN